MTTPFTATHYALMMAWISRAVMNKVGDEEGERVIRKAVARCGQQRGHRTALRAEANGRQTTSFTESGKPGRMSWK